MNTVEIACVSEYPKRAFQLRDHTGTVRYCSEAEIPERERQRVIEAMPKFVRVRSEK